MVLSWLRAPQLFGLFNRFRSGLASSKGMYDDGEILRKMVESGEVYRERQLSQDAEFNPWEYDGLEMQTDTMCGEEPAYR